MSQEARNDRCQDRPILEYIAGGIGFVLTLTLIGFIAREAFTAPSDQAPFVAVTATGVQAIGGGFEVGFEARNLGSDAASNVDIEATLLLPDAEPVISQVSLNYVPGGSTRRGGVFLPVDPAAGELRLRALGYARP